MLVMFNISVWRSNPRGKSLLSGQSIYYSFFGIYLDLPTSRTQIFSRRRSAKGRFFLCFLRQKRARERELRAAARTTRTGNEKRRTLRKSSLYREDQLACLHCRIVPVVLVVPVASVIPVVPAVLVVPVDPFVPVIPVVPIVQAAVVQKLDSAIYRIGKPIALSSG